MPDVGRKAIKYRIYPTDKQSSLFICTFGCCRKVWNLMLSDREDAYMKDKSVFKPTPAMYKDDYPYLKDVDSLALANTQLDLEGAYTRFFTVKGTGHPKFKSRKHSRASYTTNNQKGTVYVDFDAGIIHLPKVGNVKAVLHRMPEAGWRLKSATVSMTKSGKFYCSVLYEYDEHITPVSHPEENAVGLDYKSDGLYVSSDHETCGSPKYYRKAQDCLKKAQRKLRHKTKGSNNYNKACKGIARVHEDIANRRRDFLQKQSTGIANRYDMICVEDLDMKAMSNKGFHNGKATMDNGYGMFLRMLEYKMHDRGKVLIRIDKWYPSSQICSCCGAKNPFVRDLSIKEWICPECGTVHDRDDNASVNIKYEGINEYMTQ